MRKYIVLLLLTTGMLVLSGCESRILTFDRYGPSDKAYTQGIETQMNAQTEIAQIQADADRAVAAANEQIAEAEAKGLETWAKFEFRKFASAQWTIRLDRILDQFLWIVGIVTIWIIMGFWAVILYKAFNHALWERRIKVIQLSTGEVPPWAFLLEPRILDAILKRAKEVGGVISWSPKRINIVIVETGQILTSYVFK